MKIYLSSLELYYVSYIIYFSGKIAEYILLIADIIQNALNDKQLDVLQRKEITQLLERTLEYYEKVLDIYNKKDQHQKFMISEYNEFETAIKEFRKKNMYSWRPIISEYIMMLVRTVKEMEFIMINLENTPKTQ